MKPTTTTTTAPPCRPCAVREAPYTHVSAFQLALLPPSAPLAHSPTAPFPHFRGKGDAELKTYIEKQTKLFVFCVLWPNAKFMTLNWLTNSRVNDYASTCCFPRKAPAIVHHSLQAATSLFSLIILLESLFAYEQLLIARIYNAILLLCNMWENIGESYFSTYQWKVF